MTPKAKQLLIYAAKCVAGTALVFVLGNWLKYNDTSWCVISVLLVLSPDQKEAIPLAMNRIKANLVGAGIGALSLMLPLPNIVKIGLALSIAIFVCDGLKLVAATRSALAAVVIIMLHEEGKHLWDTALERIIAVVSGCVLALIITYLFHFNARQGKGLPITGNQEG